MCHLFAYTTCGYNCCDSFYEDYILLRLARYNEFVSFVEYEIISYLHTIWLYQADDFARHLQNYIFQDIRKTTAPTK